MEVMAASVILSVFVLGIGGMWRASSDRVTDLVIKQKAVFVLNAEMERLSALYAYTSFGDDGSEMSYGWGTTNGLPDTRLSYPSTLAPYIGGSDNYVTTSKSQFAANDFRVWNDNSFFGLWDRSYVWIDRDSNIAGRLSWVTQSINVDDCIGGPNCSCHDFDGGDNPLYERHCRTLELYLDYPYRRDSEGEMVLDGSRQSLTLATIVGRL